MPAGTSRRQARHQNGDPCSTALAAFCGAPLAQSRLAPVLGPARLALASSLPTPLSPCTPRSALAGKFFLVQFPQVAQLLLPLDPLIRLYYSFPLAGLILFFAVYLVGAARAAWRAQQWMASAGGCGFGPQLARCFSDLHADARPTLPHPPFVPSFLPADGRPRIG